jgi:two-component system sensor histidine kinase/response regulator
MLYLDWRFLPLFEAVDPRTAYQGIYQPGLVAISLAIAILAACVALSISDRIIAADTSIGRVAWSAGGAITMGGGIWSMHFIGMLAFSLPCGVSYDLIGTILSMIPGILASGVALNIISRRVVPDLKRLLIGAVLMGGGIGAMHYSGMAAMRPEATLLYDPTLVAVSLMMAITLAFVSLSLRFRSWGLGSGGLAQTLAAGSVMGCGVAGMHYMAMQAAIFFPLPVTSTWNMALPRTALALGIVTVTVLVGIIMLIATFAARQTDLARTLREEFTRRQALERDAEAGRARLQAILDGVADGIVTIDSGGGIRQWSSGAQRLFGYTAEEVLGADIAMLMPEPHRSRHHQYVASFLTTGDPKIIGIGRELSDRLPLEMRDPSAQRLDHPDVVKWLHQEIIHADGQTTLTHIRQCMRGQGDDRHPLRCLTVACRHLLQVADPLGRLQSIQDRHLAAP